MTGVMNPVPAGLPSKSIFLTPLEASFWGSGAAEDTEAATPKPETSVAKRPANALRVKRLENICDSPFRFDRSSEILRQCKTENVCTRGNGNVLFPQHGVTHRRSANRLAHGEVPQRRARFRINSFERLRIVAEKDQSCRGAHGSCGGIPFTCLRILPAELARIEIVGQQNLLRFCSAAAAYAGRIVAAPFGETLGFHKKSAAVLQRQKVKLMRVGVVRWRIPVRCAGKPGAYFRAFRRRARASQNGPAVRVDFLRPVQPVDESRRRQEFPVRAIQHIKETVSVGLHE